MADKWLVDLVATPGDIHHNKLKDAVVRMESAVQELYAKSQSQPIEHVKAHLKDEMYRIGADAYQAGKLWASQFTPLEKTGSLINWDYKQDIDKIVNRLGLKMPDSAREIVHNAIQYGEGPPVEQLAHKMGYEQGKSIARTVMMNLYAKSALRKWEKDGIVRVKRMEFNDKKTCAICKALNGREYQLSDLVDLDMPLTNDSHENCRGTYSAIIDEETYSPRQEKLPETIDLKVGDNEVKNLPLGLKPWFVNMMKKEELPKIRFDKNLKASYVDTGKEFVINPKLNGDEDHRESIFRLMSKRKWPKYEEKFKAEYMPLIAQGVAKPEKTFSSPQELFEENYIAWKLNQMDDDIMSSLWFYENEV